MRKIFIILSIFLCVNASAQLGDFLNKAKKEIQKNIQLPNVEQKASGNGAATTQADQKNTNTKNISSEEFCQRLKKFEELEEFAKYAKKLATEYNQSYRFDTKDALISNWIFGKIKQLNQKDQTWFSWSYVPAAEAAINECAASIRDSDLLYLMSNSRDDYNHLIKQLTKKMEAETPQTIRKVDASGNVVVENVKPKTTQNIRGVGSYGSTSIDSDLSRKNTISSEWLVSWLIILDEEGKVLKSIYPEIKSEITARIASIESEKSQSLARREREKQEENNRKAKEQQAQQAEIDKYNKFANSPEGKLTITYQYYQIMKTCHDIRKGYAVKFINDEEISNYTSKTKVIESLIKKNVRDINTDNIWSEAVKRNQNWNPMEGSGYNVQMSFDVIETIKSNVKSNFAAAKSDCAGFQTRFDNHIVSILGKDEIKKSF